MKRLLLAMVMMAGPALAQTGPTQSRDGLGDAGHLGEPANSMPAGTENATTGPQSRPAYPSGSSTANPGAAFVRNQPVPATGVLTSSPGALATTTVGPNGQVANRPGPGPTTEGAGVAPPK